MQADELFDTLLVGGEEVQAGAAEKPAASIFLTACRLAGCEPHEVRTRSMRLLCLEQHRRKSLENNLQSCYSH